MAALKALYHRGRVVELNVLKNTYSLQVGKEGHTVKLWRIGKEIGQAIRRKKRGEGGEELVAGADI